MRCVRVYVCIMGNTALVSHLPPSYVHVRRLLPWFKARCATKRSAAYREQNPLQGNTHGFLTETLTPIWSNETQTLPQHYPCPALSHCPHPCPFPSEAKKSRCAAPSPLLPCVFRKTCAGCSRPQHRGRQTPPPLRRRLLRIPRHEGAVAPAPCSPRRKRRSTTEAATVAVVASFTARGVARAVGDKRWPFSHLKITAAQGGAIAGGRQTPPRRATEGRVGARNCAATASSKLRRIAEAR